jgi:hypothetical protein
MISLPSWMERIGNRMRRWPRAYHFVDGLRLIAWQQPLGSAAGRTYFPVNGPSASKIAMVGSQKQRQFEPPTGAFSGLPSNAAKSSGISGSHWCYWLYSLAALGWFRTIWAVSDRTVVAYLLACPIDDLRTHSRLIFQTATAGRPRKIFHSYISCFEVDAVSLETNTLPVTRSWVTAPSEMCNFPCFV